MNEKKFDQALTLLKPLADQLGTTIHQLWAVLVHQAQINAFLILAFIGLWLGSLAGGSFVLKKHLKTQSRQTQERDLKTDVLAAFLIIDFAVGFIITLIIFPQAVTGLVNPQYWALQKILELVR